MRAITTILLIWLCTVGLAIAFTVKNVIDHVNAELQKIETQSKEFSKPLTKERR